MLVLTMPFTVLMQDIIDAMVVTGLLSKGRGELLGMALDSCRSKVKRMNTGGYDQSPIISPLRKHSYLRNVGVGVYVFICE